MFMTHIAPPNGLDPGDRMPEGSESDLMAKLMGDWSWRPQMQPVDPGYIYDAMDREAVAFSIAVRAEHGLRPNQMTLQALRPWTVRSYDYAELLAKPPRIGPRS